MPPDGVGDRRQLVEHRSELRRTQRLIAVRERLVGSRMYFHHHAIGSSRDRRGGEITNDIGSARGVTRIDDHGKMGLQLEDRYGRNVQGVSR
jgi:hypothetical protein